MSRGVDVPDAEMVINFDIPVTMIKKQHHPDVQTYLHRIGRSGRFGRQALALNLYDRDTDKENLDKIIAHYKFEDKIKDL